MVDEASCCVGDAPPTEAIGHALLSSCDTKYDARVRKHSFMNPSKPILQKHVLLEDEGRVQKIV